MNILDQMKKEGDALQRARSAHQLAVRVLSMLDDAWELHIPLAKNDPEFGLQWFNENCNFRLYLVASRTEVSPMRLLKSFKKAKLWIAFMETLEEYSPQPVGMVTPAMGTKLWIIHNWWQLPQIAGHPRVAWLATDEVTGVIFEPLEAFIRSVSAAGQTP